MKTIDVVAAVIKSNNKILATERGYGDFKGQWEFPGGKIKEGETHEKALIREIKEELNANIVVDKFLKRIEWDYPNFHLTMHCYMCSLVSKKYELLEHLDAKWLSKDDLYSVNWLPADLVLLPSIIDQ